MDKRLEKYFNYVVDDLLSRTTYSRHTFWYKDEVEIDFPMYGEKENDYSFTKSELNDGASISDWTIGTSDIRYAESQYGLTRNESLVLYPIYWNKLCRKILDEYKW